MADYELWEGAWELWEGVPMAMSPAPSQAHQIVAGNIYHQLKSQLDANDKCRCRAVYEVDWRINEKSVLRPDIVVVCDQPVVPYLTSPPTVAVEVASDSTRRRDRNSKREVYADLGVKYYLLADPETRHGQLLVAGPDGYTPTAPELELHEGCRLRLDRDAMWRGLPPS